MKPKPKIKVVAAKPIDVFPSIISVLILYLFRPCLAQSISGKVLAGEESNITASNGAAFERVGNSIATSGDTSVVGGGCDNEEQ